MIVRTSSSDSAMLPSAGSISPRFFTKPERCAEAEWKDAADRCAVKMEEIFARPTPRKRRQKHPV